MIDGEELPLLINFSAGKSKGSPNEVPAQHGEGRASDVSAHPVTRSRALH